MNKTLLHQEIIMFNSSTVVHLYVATLARSHPSNEARISEIKLCIIVSKIPVTRGHSSNKAKFSIPQRLKGLNTFNIVNDVIILECLFDFNKLVLFGHDLLGCE